MDAPPEDVVFSEEGVAALGCRVPVLEALTNHRAAAGEDLRLLRARFRDLCRRREARCVAVTSAGPGEGKSTLAVGLAAAMAQDRSQRILLIEADLRRPSLARMLGLAPAKGLGDWLGGQADYLPVRRVEPAGFFLLVAGQTALEQPETLGSTRMGAFLGAARTLFDFVLLDAMPLLPVADAVLIQDLVDGFVCVVRARKTPRAALLAALDRLHPDRVLGTILNDQHDLLPSYAARAYRMYGLSGE
jgi:succinoglycan biosynthesis transport protein ExoP